MDENQSDIFHFIILNLWNGGWVHEYEWLNRDTRMLGRVKFLLEVKTEPARKNGIIDETRRRLEDWKNLWLAHICIFWTICFISTEIHYFEDTLYFFTKIFLRLPSKQIIEREHVKDVNAASWSWAHKTLQFFHSSILHFFRHGSGFQNS